MAEPYWRGDGVELYLGDMREVLPALGITADLVLADPPYEETSNDWDRWPDGWVEVAADTAPALWCFGSLRMYLAHGHEFPAADWRLSHDVEAEWDHVVWEKNSGSGPGARDRFLRVHEIAAHWYRGSWQTIYHQQQRAVHHGPRKGTVATTLGVDHRGEYGSRTWTDDGTRALRSVLRVPSMRQLGAIHPAQKPVGILTPLIEYACPPGGLVLDPFAGSGSTLEAARLTGRRAIGIEGYEPYAEAAARRLAQAPLEIA